MSSDVWEKLRKLKIHEREPFNDVIKRLLDLYEKCGGGEKKAGERGDDVEGKE
ncbi:MAG: hypothetical protein QW532_01620 [Archaeoglobaceae archaeon]